MLRGNIDYSFCFTFFFAFLTLLSALYRVVFFYLIDCGIRLLFKLAIPFTIKISLSSSPSFGKSLNIDSVVVFSFFPFVSQIGAARIPPLKL